jgi:hypothetical protein
MFWEVNNAVHTPLKGHQIRAMFIRDKFKYSVVCVLPPVLASRQLTDLTA